MGRKDLSDEGECVLRACSSKQAMRRLEWDGPKLRGTDVGMEVVRVWTEWERLRSVSGDRRGRVGSDAGVWEWRGDEYDAADEAADDELESESDIGGPRMLREGCWVERCCVATV